MTRMIIIIIMIMAVRELMCKFSFHYLNGLRCAVKMEGLVWLAVNRTAVLMVWRSLLAVSSVTR